MDDRHVVCVAVDGDCRNIMLRQDKKVNHQLHSKHALNSIMLSIMVTRVPSKRDVRVRGSARRRGGGRGRGSIIQHKGRHNNSHTMNVFVCCCYV